jgi:ASC-1-like (ASCH) protein
MTTHNWISEALWFTHLQKGSKNIEARLASKVTDVQIGDSIKFESRKRTVVRKVVSMQMYTSFAELLTHEGVENVLPSVTDISQGVAVFRKWYDKKAEERVGVVAVRLQPCIPAAVGIESFFKKRKIAQQ